MELSWSQQLIEQGHQEGRQEGRLELLTKHFAKRLKRALAEEEKKALAAKLEALGADRLSDVLFDLSPARLLAWLLDENAR
jgi:hypothetical protein